MAGSSRFAVKQRVTHRHDDGIGKHHDPGEIKALQAAWRVKHHMRDTCRYPEHAPVVQRPGGDNGQIGKAAFEPDARRLLPVDVAQHDRAAATGAPGRQIGSKRGFSASAFAVNDGNNGHQIFRNMTDA